MQVILHPTHQLTPIAAICKDSLQTGQMFRPFQQALEGLFTCMDILNIGRSHFSQHQQPECVHNQVAFASTHLFSSIETTLFAAFGTFGRLTVDNHGTRLGFSPFFFPHGFSDHSIQFFPSPCFSKLGKIVIHCLPGWIFMRQCPPYTSILHHIEYAVQDLAPRIFPWPSLQVCPTISFLSTY